jgi:predicted protein tyrosine phosphatase
MVGYFPSTAPGGRPRAPDPPFPQVLSHLRTFAPSHFRTAVLNLLFVCSRNRQRSLTAETAFDGVGGHEVRSVGTEPGARIRVTAGHVGWADVVFVMEKKHLRRLEAKYADELRGRRVVTLHVPDEYDYMDEALIDRLAAAIAPYLDDDERGCGAR